MDILFIYSVESALSIEKPLSSPIYIQFGISYLSSFLKQSNHNTDLLVLSRSFGEKNYNITKKKIENFKPKIIGFYSVASQYKFILNIANFIKSNYPEIFLIIGGPNATLNPDKVIEDNFDAICIGEGERPLLELMDMLEKKESPSNIKNLWIKKDNKITKNQVEPFYEKIDLLPYPDRTIWEEYTEFTPGLLKWNISVLLGIGCPYYCTFCCNNALSKIADGNYVRFRSPQNIIEEIKLVNKKYPFENNIYLEIESFNANKEWAIDVCNEIEKYNKSLNKPISFRLNIRITPDADFESIFEACKRANILSLNMGLESGSERIRRNILRRNYSNDDVIRTVNLARKYGLRYRFNVMIGIPGETKEDIKETIKICRICQPEEIMLSIYYPYPGTELYELCDNMNLLNDQIDLKLEERTLQTINLPNFSKRQLKNIFVWFDYNTYKGYRSRTRLILKVIIKLLRSNHLIILILSMFSRSPLIAKFKKYVIEFYFK